MSVNFEASPTDRDLIGKCADRAAKELSLDGLQTVMDLTVANNDTPLDLAGLLTFSTFDFAHDVYGIARHLNRETGKIEGCFWPRCAKKEATV